MDVSKNEMAKYYYSFNLLLHKSYLHLIPYKHVVTGMTDLSVQQVYNKTA